MDDYDLMQDARFDADHPSRRRALWGGVNGTPPRPEPTPRELQREVADLRARVTTLGVRLRQIEEPEPPPPGPPVVSLGQGSFRRDITPRQLHRLLSVRRLVGWLRKDTR